LWVEVLLRLRGSCLLDPGGLGPSIGVNQVDLLLFAASDPLVVCLDFVITSALVRLFHFILLLFINYRQNQIINLRNEQSFD